MRGTALGFTVGEIVSRNVSLLHGTAWERMFQALGYRPDRSDDVRGA
jgi:hypothetical protein